jgi:hypothetical protein
MKTNIHWKEAEDCKHFWAALSSTSHMTYNDAKTMVEKFYILQESEACYGTDADKMSKLKNYAYRHLARHSLAFQMMHDIQDGKPPYPVMDEDADDEWGE